MFDSEWKYIVKSSKWTQNNILGRKMMIKRHNSHVTQNPKWLRQESFANFSRKYFPILEAIVLLFVTLVMYKDRRLDALYL